MGFLNWQIMTHFSHPGKKYNRSSLLSHEKNSRHKKRAPERHVYFYYYNPLDQGQVINCQIYDHVFFTSVVTPAGLNKLNNDLL